MSAIISDASVLICLGAAQQLHLQSALKPVLDVLIQQHSFRLARSLYERTLQQAGEAP